MNIVHEVVRVDPNTYASGFTYRFKVTDRDKNLTVEGVAYHDKEISTKIQSLVLARMEEDLKLSTRSIDLLAESGPIDVDEYIRSGRAGSC